MPHIWALVYKDFKTTSLKTEIHWNLIFMFGLAPGRSFSVTTRKHMSHDCIAAVQSFEVFGQSSLRPQCHSLNCLVQSPVWISDSKINEFKKTFWKYYLVCSIKISTGWDNYHVENFFIWWHHNLNSKCHNKWLKFRKHRGELLFKNLVTIISLWFCNQYLSKGLFTFEF